MSDDDGASTFHCGVCRFSTEEDDDLLAHYDKEHKKELYYWCRGCSNIVKSPKDLVAHIKDDCTKEKSFTFLCGAKNCDFSTKDVCLYMDHCRDRHKSVLLFSCKNCSRFFTITSCLMHHMQTECTQENHSKETSRKTPSPGTKSSRTSTMDKSKDTIRSKTPQAKAKNKVKFSRGKTGGKAKSPQGGMANSSASTSRMLQEDDAEMEEEEEEEECFSLYGKKRDPLDLSNIHVVSSHSSPLKFTGPVEEFMKLANFDMRLSVPDCGKKCVA